MKWLGYSAWVDRVSITYGIWFKKIEDAIACCRAIVIMLSESAIKSDWVYKEVSEAARLKKPMIPVRIQAVRVPQKFEAIFGHVQYIDLNQSFPKCASTIADALHGLGLDPEPFDEYDPE